jgi:F-type H+-transporting ATPase subunit b
MDLLSVLGNIGFDWKLALANLVNFLIIYYLLKRFAFGPISKIINERKSKVEEGIEMVQKAEVGLSASQEEAEKIISNARHESNEIIAKAHDQAKVLIEHASIQSAKDKDTMLAQMQAKIEKERHEMQSAVQGEISDLIIMSTEKIIGKDISEDSHKKIISAMAK